MTDPWTTVERDALETGLSPETSLLLALVEAPGPPDVAALARLGPSVRRWALAVLLYKSLSVVASELADEWLSNGWCPSEEDREVMALLFPDRVNQGSSVECLHAVEGFLAEGRRGEAVALLSRPLELGSAAYPRSWWAARHALSWAAAGNEAKALEAAVELRHAAPILELRILAAIAPDSTQLCARFAEVWGTLRPTTDPHHCLRVMLFALGMPGLRSDKYFVFHPEKNLKFLRALANDLSAFYSVAGAASLMAVLVRYPPLDSFANEVLIQASSRLLRKKAISRAIGIMPTVEGLVAAGRWETLRTVLERGTFDRAVVLRAAQTAHYIGPEHTKLLAHSVGVAPVRVAIALNRLHEAQSRATSWGARCGKPLGWSQQLAFLP